LARHGPEARWFQFAQFCQLKVVRFSDPYPIPSWLTGIRLGCLFTRATWAKSGIREES
jgi:hypothetical protein